MVLMRRFAWFGTELLDELEEATEEVKSARKAKELRLRVASLAGQLKEVRMHLNVGHLEPQRPAYTR